jgi:hypothetical protein
MPTEPFTAFRPVGGGHPHGDGPLGRKSRANRVEHFKRKAQAVFQAAAIFVLAPVRERGQKLVQQVAVCRMDLDKIDAQPRRAARRLRKRVANTGEPLAIQRDRRVLAFLVGKRRGRFRLPAGRLAGRDLRAALPGHPGGRLAAGMGKLDADRHVRIAPHRPEHPLQRRLVGIVPQAKVVGRDSAFGSHRGGFQDQQPGARMRKGAEMLQVPVGGAAFTVGRILAHRRNDDAVGEG